MPTVEIVRCDFCRGRFPTVDVADRHERTCESRPTGASPDAICQCGKREDAREGGFVHGDLEPSNWYVHRPSGWKFPDRDIGQHVFRAARTEKQGGAA